MTVYLGTFGKVELKRKMDSKLTATILGINVDATQKNFSFDFDLDQLITGDRVTIKNNANNDALRFLNGASSSITKFINVNDAGKVRLYNSFADALSGGASNALALTRHTGDTYNVDIIVDNKRRIIAQINGYELNTQRETVDTTVLSDNFRQSVSTLISGSGKFNAFWEYIGDNAKEMPNYLLQLILRTKVGSNFVARLYLKDDDYNPSGNSLYNTHKMWYQVEGIITAAAVQFRPDNVVEIAADFITTGKIELEMKLEDDFFFLKDEAGDFMLLDDDSDGKIGLVGTV